MHEYNIKQLQNIVEAIDESLIFKEFLYGNFCNGVCVIEKENSLYLLKFSHKAHDWQRLHIKNEAKLLEIAKYAEGITHLVCDYSRDQDIDNSYVAILKEYIEGQDLRELGGKITETPLQIQLEQTVKKLHSLGIARLDISNRNIVISPDRSEAKIIDLGFGQTKKEAGIIFGFRSMKKIDLYRLEELFI